MGSERTDDRHHTATQSSSHHCEFVIAGRPRRNHIFSLNLQLAKRVAEEKGCLVGREVGYCVRFDECFDKEATKIKVCLSFLQKFESFWIELNREFILHTTYNFSS